MSLGLFAALAVLTYASRALALVLMPDPPSSLRTRLERIPAPLFASLAVLALVNARGNLASPVVLASAGAALLAAPSRSMLLILAAGLLGYGAGLLALR